MYHVFVKNKGFTLIEVMVALAIVAVAMLAMVDSMTTHAHVSSELEEKVISGWVASNVVAEIRHNAKVDRIKEGSTSDIIKMGGHRWRARTKITETDVEKVFLVNVEVFNMGDRTKKSLANVTTAVTDPL